MKSENRMGKIEIENGKVVQGNFDDYPLLTMAQTPKIHTEVIKSTEKPTGAGEPGATEVHSVRPGAADPLQISYRRFLQSNLKQDTCSYIYIPVYTSSSNYICVCVYISMF